MPLPNPHHDGRRLKRVMMPPVSLGRCRIYQCWFVGDLGDGLCVTHWDRGLDRVGRNHHKRPG